MGSRSLILRLVRPMARVLLIILFFMAGSRCSFCAVVTDEERVVRAMIAAAQADQLGAFLRTVDLPRISAASKGECTSETVIAIGKLLAADDVLFETRRRGDLRVVRAIRGGEITAWFAVHGLAKTIQEPEGRLVIVSVDVKIPSDTW